ncbi:MAG TPA: LamG-like jellyroll fold domain-containing protein [Nocardioides sp.]|jgi:signal peptidase I|nr:LamG-like jellyroll fold domain-containing protein [Nocardioides sp.]
MTSTADETATPAPIVEPGWGRVLTTSGCRTVLALVSSLLVWSVLPLVWGWTPQAIQSDSMAPRFVAGDVIVTRPVAASTLRPGQVITVADPDHPGRTRTHRYVRADHEGLLVTRGDANQQADSTHVAPSAVQGVAVLRVPDIALPLLWLRLHDYPPLVVCMMLMTFVLLGARRASGSSGDGGGTGQGDHRHGGRSRRPGRLRRIGAVATAGAVVSVAIGAPADAAFTRLTTNAADSFKAAAVFRPYQTAVLADSPTFFWRLQEKSGTTAADTSGNARTATITNTPAFAQTSPITSEPSDVAFGTGSNGYLTSTATSTTPTTFSVEAWVKTTSTSGGRLLGFGDGAAGSGSSSTDCQLYLAPNGKVEFGLDDDSPTALASSAAVNNGSWHYVVGTYSTSTGAKLYVDGALTASGTLAKPSSFTGRWRAGAESMSGWPSNPTSNYLSGTIDELAVYPSVLSAARITAHYTAATS